MIASGNQWGVSMAEHIDIALSQLVLWYDAARIQSWPTFLANIPHDVVLSSPTEFGRRYYTDRMTDTRHSAAEKITRNIPGLEKKGNKLVLRGVGLLTRKNNGYMLSKAAHNLVRTFRNSADRDGWVKMLARLLLMREPRTRTLLGLLSEGDAVLVFDGVGWFSGSLRKAMIRRSGHTEVYPFRDKCDSAVTLREALRERAWWALGEWRYDERLADASNCNFTGQNNEKFSLHDIGLALHASCEVLLHAGVLRSESNVCLLNEVQAASLLGSEVADDFGWKAYVVPARSLISLLDKILTELQTDTGFIVAAELRDALEAQGVDNPDREIAELEHAGKLVVYAEDYGQSRHGTGLYGDPRKQLIKLRIVAGGI